MDQKLNLDDLSWVVLEILCEAGVEFDIDIAKAIAKVEKRSEEDSSRYWWGDKTTLDDNPSSESRGLDPSWLSDRGEGVVSIIRQVDYALTDGKSEGTGRTRQQILAAARQRVRRNVPHCLEVFNLIIKNGSNREESICQMVQEAKKRK